MTTARQIATVLFCATALTACGPSFRSADLLSEQELNAPLGEDPTAVDEPSPSKDNYTFPVYSAVSGIAQSTWDKAKNYYIQNQQNLNNTRYVTMIDLGKRSNTKRFFLLDLETGIIESHATSHGSGSDPDNDGWATLFSNTPESKKSSLGIYLTGATYIGGNGRSLQLHGMEASNSNAFERLIVVHGANYVSDANPSAGRSAGCPALDHVIVQDVITKIKSGSVLLIDNP